MAQRLRGGSRPPGRPESRRHRGAEPADPALDRPSFRDRRTWLSLVVVAVLVGLVVAAGIAMAAAVRPQPPSGLGGCKTGRELAPRSYAGPPAMCIDPKRTYTANINTTKGQIRVVMQAADAPQTVNNFVVLSVNGYYNGLTFWRVENWVVQTGDPRGDGRGGPGYALPDEPSQKAWAPGSVGMARPVGGPINGSQFFITKDAWPGSGPGSTVYNRFGTVVLGFDLLQQLGADDRVLSIDIKQG